MGTSRFDSSQHGQDHLIYTSKMKAALAALLLVVASAGAGVSNRCLNTLKDGLTHEVDQASKDWILAKHNELRSKVALGKVPGHYVPKAANMEEMSWDDELAQAAQAHANKCLETGELTEGFSSGGRSIARIWGSFGKKSPDMSVEFPLAMDEWYEGLEKFSRFALSYYKGGKGSSYNGKIDVSGYTQLVWAKSNKVGCGYILYEEPEGWRGDKAYWQVTVCNYSPAGNVVGEEVYQIGSPASKCPAGTTPDVAAGLCRH